VTTNRHEPSLGYQQPHQSKARESSDSTTDRVLHQSNGGHNAQELQQMLSRLGYRNPDGSILSVDGDFGPNTRHAVESFQREHGLSVDGVAGKDTLAMVAATQANPFTNPYHPHHALYQQALHQVHAEESRRHIHPGRHSERLAGALTVQVVRDGLARIDRVELNDTGHLVRAVQVSPIRDEPGLNRTTDPIATQQASQQPLHHSSDLAQHMPAIQQHPHPVQQHQAVPQHLHAGPSLAL